MFSSFSILGNIFDTKHDTVTRYFGREILYPEKGLQRIDTDYTPWNPEGEVDLHGNDLAPVGKRAFHFEPCRPLINWTFSAKGWSI